MSIKINYIICLLNFLLRKMDAHLKDCCCNLWDGRGGGVEMLHGVQYLRKKSGKEKVQWESLGCLLDLSQEKVEYWVQEG